MSHTRLRVISRLAVDVTVARNPAFRRLLIARTVTRLGTNATTTVLLLNVAEVTKSPAAVGLLGAVQLPAVLVLGLYGGHLADRHDRRRLALVTEAALMAGALLLAGNALVDSPSLVVLYAVPAVTVGLTAIQGAALDAAVPRLVPMYDISAASALLTSAVKIGGIGGPVLGAAMYLGWGPALAYALDAGTYVISFLLLVGLPAVRPAGPASAQRVLPSLQEGWRYVRSRADLSGSYLVDLAAMGLASPAVLLPFLASDLQAGRLTGVLFAAEAVGALVMVTFSGWTGTVQRVGRGVVIAGAGYAASIALLGPSPGLPAVVLLLAVAGAFDLLSVVFRDTLWNLSVPDHLRGRVAGVEAVSYGLGAPSGALLLGLLASVTTPQVALSLGALGAAALIGVIALTNRPLVTFRRDQGPPEAHTPATPTSPGVAR